MDAARMLYLHALSPLHSGTGQAAGVIDLPVAREVTTAWPYLPGSTVKGVLRDVCAPENGADRSAYEAAFGPETENASDFAGALWFSDARLLCWPVRSLYGTLAWLTCPLALARWERDQLRGGSEPRAPIPHPSRHEEILVPDGAAIVDGGRVLLAELDLTATVSPDSARLAESIAAAVFDDDDWREIFRERFAIVSNDVFTFLAETATDVTAHIRLEDNTKTVQTGALWYEETVPAETIFACPLVAAPRGGQPGADELFAVLRPGLQQPVQIGGNASVGRGLTRLQLREVGS